MYVEHMAMMNEMKIKQKEKEKEQAICSFSKMHYRCAICGVYSATPDDLCSPVEHEFKQ